MPVQKKRGIILMNLGSPDSLQVKDVRKYLNEFLMDGRVMDTNYLWRSVLVKGIITPFRAPKSAEAYSAIWGNDGSPLVAITYQQQRELQQLTAEPIEVAMRYGNPSMKTAYDAMLARHPEVNEVVLLPLYPHYAMSSYETAVEHAKEVHKKGKYPFSIKAVPAFYSHPAYIEALAASMAPYIERGKHLLFSYHSIPERHVQKTDATGSHCLRSADCCDVVNPGAQNKCYRRHCFTTMRLVAQKLGLPAGSYSISFQSKLGRSEWLKPSTTLRMEQMPGEGIKDLLVVCPSFVTDCLETLEEIAIREKENFMNAGGRSFTFIPCMNIQPAWIKAMAALVTI